ncbi:MAG TPA: beta-ketoacyl-ACP synthase III [Phycisphaerales bacterium]|nr:beta-ketoacyl-ACP synthase III [Phycisphaerales bacterium]
MTNAGTSSRGGARLESGGTGLVLGVHVTGYGYYLPKQVITNADLAAMVDTSDEWILERTGIRSRHRAGSHEATSDLAIAAATDAMNRAGVAPGDLDMVVVATATPDSPVPAVSCLVQAGLGASNAAAMDVGAGCSGFLFAMHTAACFVRAGAARRVLVVGAETLTRVTDYADRRSCILFGDGAGAAVVTAPEAGAESAGGAPGRDGLELLYSSLGTDGEMSKLIEIPAGGSRNPASEATVQRREHYLRLDGQAVFRQAVRRMAEAAKEALEATGLAPDGIDWLLPHQANARIVTAVAEQTGIAPARAMLDMAETGNTSAASIPITLGRARDSGQLAPGQTILMLAFGAGLTWACQVWRVRG